MKHTTVILTETQDGYVLSTILGNPVGRRMHTVKPEGNKDYPAVPEGPIKDKLTADRLRLAWNVYLHHAWKNRSKSKARTAD